MTSLDEFLLAYAFDPKDLDAPRQHGLTPLMRAALAGETALVRELLARKVDVNARNADGNQALWLACVAENGDIVRLLVEAGSALDNLNDTGATPLMYAASSGKAGMVTLLLALGADPKLSNQDGMRALDMAANHACLALLRQAAR